MLGSRVRASFCFATPFSLGSEKVFLKALAYSGSSALEGQPNGCPFLFSCNECSRRCQVNKVIEEIAQLVEYNLAPKERWFISLIFFLSMIRARVRASFSAPSPKVRTKSSKTLWNIVSEGFVFVVGWYRSDFVEPLPDIARTSKCPSEYPPWKYSDILNNKRIATSFSVQNISTLTNVYKSYGQIKPHICSSYCIYHQPSSFTTVYQIFGPYLSLNFVKFLLSITFTSCIGK